MGTSLFEILKTYKDWGKFFRLNYQERRFMKNMTEALFDKESGLSCLGDSPKDNEVIEQCGLSNLQIKWLRDIWERHRTGKKW